MRSRSRSPFSSVPPLLVLVTSTAAGWTAAGCGDGSEPGSSPAPAASSGGDPALTEPAVEEVVEPGRQLLVRRVRAFMDEWSGREGGFLEAYRQGFTARLAELGWWKKLSTRAYEARGLGLVFSNGQDLEPAADVLVQALDRTADHGLDPARYDMEEVRKLLADVEAKKKAYAEAVRDPDDRLEESLWKVVQKLRASARLDLEALESALEERGLSDEHVGLVDLAAKRLDGMFAAKAALNDALRELDLALLTRTFWYVYDMRFARRVHPFDSTRDDAAGVSRAADDVFEVVQGIDFRRLGDALLDLEPRHPFYRKTMEGLAFYRQLAAAGGQVELSARVESLKKGRKGPDVTALQERLLQEGYLEGEATGVFDDALEKAVLLYQETHQLKETGQVDRGTRKSMNKPYAERVDDLVLSLQRHRESELHQGEWRFGDVEVQVRVNIPAFTAYVYRNGAEVRRHRVVVGNNNLEVHEETGTRGYFNRTRLFAAEMDTIVMNPTWKVPPRIKEQELDLELAKEPDYYERHGYKIEIRDDGTEEVTQLPGPGNALGLVKFLFPNPYSIYMHDTPKKPLFAREIRAFSHGCMRTEGALDLAKWVLTEVQGVSPERFQEILDSRETYGIGLTKKIPVAVDYNTVGVHDSGRMMFYADIYKFDRDWREGKTPYEQGTEPGMEQVVLLR